MPQCLQDLQVYVQLSGTGVMSGEFRANLPPDILLPQTVMARLSSGKVFECGVTNIQDSADFEKRVLSNSAPVLVDFHATWYVPSESFVSCR